jgi:aspartyl-tRNA(Asn)/glutamyl-tRNA(Gln) amidotransferase subunit A
MTDYRYASITEISELIRQKQISPLELTKACLERIERLQPQLNAFITVAAEQALQDAAKAEQEIQAGKWKGALHGIPVAVKDFFDTAGIRTTAAFAPFEKRVPAKDAELVTRLKKAGAIMVGKLNMHQLGMGTTSVTSHFGAVHNPWNIDYAAGGSSGGSAAAVAAGLCYATIDTDAVGSCRLPAAICGVVGFKGTYGLLSPKGILEGEQADDFILLHSHPTFMCRAVEDAAILLNALATPEASEIRVKSDYRQALSANQKLRIGVARNFKASDEVRKAFSQALETFYNLGYSTQEIDAPLEFPSTDLQRIEQDRQSISQVLFRDVDVLILPTTTDVTPTIEEARIGGDQAVAADNTFFANYYGFPAISIPCGFSDKGLPLGLQIVGPRWGEGVVLNAAYAFQQATTWHKKHPSFV